MVQFEYDKENSRNETKTIGTTAEKIGSRLPLGTRKVIVFTNVSTAGQIITISTGGANAANAGIPLRVGDKWVESEDNTFKPSNDEWWAIADGAGATLAIYERQKVVD
jgi:hypothetical protein